MDVLAIVNNVQQVPSKELAASHEKTDTSSRFVLAVQLADRNIKLHTYI